ncbi:lipopolysaccharide biosynthesis protein [Cellulomonas sp. URHD0024]|uniref:lipopolysaccharide biosynthesis protein n=1 Tax=Cellulomonas sp. URHD0024 TaxID=1302620 RepID=UPI0003F6ACF0|nr:lipopolysaccharide biosynthesis protein [Cellulomonas sp. URHD0024]
MSRLAGAAARGTAVTVGVQIGRIVLQFGSVIVLARLLTPSAFGLVAMVTAIIGVAELIRDFGLSLASIQAKDVSRAERGNLFWANTGLGTACALLALALTPLIVRIYDEPTLARLVPPLAAVFVLSGMTTQYRADLARNLRFTAVAFADLVGPASGILAAIGLAVAGAGYWALVAQQLVAAAVTLAFTVLCGRWAPGWYRRSVSIARFFRFGGGVLGAQLLNYLTRNVDNIAIGARWGPQELGLYSRAYMLVMVPINQINAPLTNVAVPVLSRVHEDRSALTAGLKRAQLVACYVTAPALVVAAALAQPLILVVLGKQWTEVAPMFAILALGGLFRSISQIAYWAYLATAHTAALFRLQLWTQPVMVVLIVGGVPWGGVGVAVGGLVANIFYWIASLVAVGRSTGVGVGALFSTAATAVLGVALPAGLAAWGAAHLVDGPLAQIAAGLLAAVLAVLVVGALTPPVRRDAATIVRTVRLVTQH